MLRLRFFIPVGIKGKDAKYLALLALVVVLFQCTTMKYLAEHYIPFIKSDIFQQTSATILASSVGEQSFLLRQGVHYDFNEKGILYSVVVNVKQHGEACFVVSFESACEYPHIRLRLTGSALLNMRLSQKSNSMQYGCIVLPIPGRYFVVVDLMSCEHGNPSLMKNRTAIVGTCIIHPKITPRDHPFFFEIKEFVEREALVMQTLQPAWVSSDGNKGRYIRTRYQLDTYDKVEAKNMIPMVGMYEGYEWATVNTQNGSISKVTMPSLKSISTLDKVCFVGSSHIRLIGFRVVLDVLKIPLNETAWPCDYNQYPQPMGNKSSQEIQAELLGIKAVKTIQLKLRDQWLDPSEEDPIAKERESQRLEDLSRCELILLSFGHWEASRRAQRLSPPGLILNYTVDIVKYIQNVSSAMIYVTSLNAMPMGSRFLSCPPTDFRVPPFVDCFNDILRNAFTPGQPLAIPGVALMDNTDIVEPLFDAAMDWCHPCRYAIPEISKRFIKIISQTLEQ